MTEVRTILEIVLLMSDNVSQADLMIKYKFNPKDILKAKKVLDFIKT